MSSAVPVVLALLSCQVNTDDALQVAGYFSVKVSSALLCFGDMPSATFTQQRGQTQTCIMSCDAVLKARDIFLLL